MVIENYMLFYELLETLGNIFTFCIMILSLFIVINPNLLCLFLLLSSIYILYLILDAKKYIRNNKLHYIDEN